MKPDEIEYKIETVNGGHVRLAIVAGGEELAVSLLEAADLEELIEGLAMARARLIDQVPLALDNNIRVVGVPNPAHRVLRGPPDTGCILAVRHPGYGWLHYMLPPAAATKLSRDLVKSLPGG